MVRILFSDAKNEKTFLNLPFQEQVKKSVVFEGNQNCSNEDWDEKQDCTIDYVRTIRDLSKKEAKEFLQKNLGIIGFPIKDKEFQKRNQTPDSELDFGDVVDVLEYDEEVTYKELVNEEGYGFLYDFDDVSVKNNGNIFDVSVDTHVMIGMQEENEDFYKEHAKDPQANHYVQEMWGDVSGYEQIFSINNRAGFKQDRNWFNDHPKEIPEVLRGKKVTSIGKSLNTNEDNTYIAFLNSNHLEFIGIKQLDDSQLLDSKKIEIHKRKKV